MTPPGSVITTEELRRVLATVRAHNRAAAGPKASATGDADDKEQGAAPPAASSSSSGLALWQQQQQLQQPRRAETTLKLPNGDVYTGELLILGVGRPPQLHGRGAYVCADGGRYEGSYRFGAREGSGEWRAAAAAGAAAGPTTCAAASSTPPSPPVSVRYRGSWAADAPDGTGEAWYSDGALYSGDWERGRRQGGGKLARPSGGGGGGAGGTGAGGGKGAGCEVARGSLVVVYEGEWRDDAPHGRGRWAFEDGSGFFEGEFEQGARAKGRLVALLAPSAAAGGGGGAGAGAGSAKEPAASAVDFDYRGPLRLKDGARHGDDGACLCPGRWVYRGPWRGGLRHGAPGRCRFAADGAVYEGAWADDLPHGEGTWREANGDAYVGTFCKGLREGRGVWRSGGGEERYAGGWRLGQRDGRGECRYADCGRYAGEWRQGRRHGRGRMRFPDGAVFDGAWEDDGWVQGAADPRFCRIRGLRRTIAATADGGPAPAREAPAFAAAAGREAEEHDDASHLPSSSSPGWFFINARDELGNARLSGGDAFSVVVEGPLTAAADAPGAAAAAADGAPAAPAVAADVLDAGDGTYRVRLPPLVLRTAGEYCVHVTDALAGEVVAGAPLPLTVRAGPADPRRCSCSRSSPRQQERQGPPSQAPSRAAPLLRPGDVFEARVDARDALGNATGGAGGGDGGAPFSVEASLVWRGPLAGAASGWRGAGARGHQAGSSTPPAPPTTALALSAEPDARGWAVRGLAPLACGEYLLEIVRRGRRPRRAAGAAAGAATARAAGAAGAAGGPSEEAVHLPCSPLLVVVAGEDEVEGDLTEACLPRAVATDEARAWAARAAAADEEGEAAAADGSSSGAAAALPPGASASERAFIERNPLVPVVENLRDLHLVSRVLAMREDARTG